MPSLRVGDIVRLRSGGPDMTVEGLRSGGLVDCVWFDEGSRQAAAFHFATLLVVSSLRPAPKPGDKSKGNGDAADTSDRPAGKPRRTLH
ncbi:DUF2158 domain-containing protein [Rhodovulum sp. 12E13]|uniref:YodC family protein n=1 Tax=Rhodovulum sp. 12E13 TaxID=2203891 RepID=UPI000E1318B7|nr:DUF2158 domain-containing protein [Rhodovulum sp. 12E13]RDC71925.1 DUF2158 domain-containing protein [Rhodovulum sp. 12E13]